MCLIGILNKRSSKLQKICFSPQSNGAKILFYDLIFLLALIIGLTIRLGIWIVYLNRPENFVQPDTLSYLEPGMQVLTDGSFPSFTRTPIYPLFLALATKFLSPTPATLTLLQIFISLMTIGILYCLCKRFFESKIAILTSIFMALDITSAISANHLLSETLFTFLFCICFVTLLSIYVHYKPDLAYLLGITFIGIGYSILALCRPIALFLFIVVAIWLYLVLKGRDIQKLVFVCCFCIGSMLLPSSWIIRNHALTGEFFFSTISSTNIYEYRAAWIVSRINNQSFDDIRNEFMQRAELEKKNSNLNEGELAKWKQSEGIKILKNNLLLTLQQGFDGLIKMYVGISNAAINQLSKMSGQNKISPGPITAQNLQNAIRSAMPMQIIILKAAAILHLILIYLGVAFSVVGLFKNRYSIAQRQVLFLILFIILYFTLLSIGAETNSRFRVPITPMLSILGAIGWANLINQIHPQVARNRFIS